MAGLPFQYPDSAPEWLSDWPGEGDIRRLFPEGIRRYAYRIVGQDEADLSKGLISVSSPVARALIGKEEGEDVEVIAPSGEIAYEISAVEYI